MTLIKNVNSSGARELPDLDLLVEYGETVDVPDDLAKSLAEQPANWEIVKAKKSKAEEAK